MGASAAPTHASVSQRRSRGVSTPRRHISPNTNPMTPASMYALIAGGDGVVMMCSYCAAASAWRWSRSVHSLMLPRSRRLQDGSLAAARDTRAAVARSRAPGRSYVLLVWDVVGAGDAHGGVPPLGGDRRQRGGLVEDRQLLRAELEIGGREVVVELLQAAGADDGRRDAGLREHPRQRDLRHRHAAL